MKQATKKQRPMIEMSQAFLTGAIEPVLADNQLIRAAVAGLYEGRQLQGRYRLEITGARLVPEDDPSPPSPNGAMA